MDDLSVKQVIKQHFKGLRPPPKVEREDGVPAKNLFRLMKGLTFMQWITFFCGWLAWTSVLSFFALIMRLACAVTDDACDLTSSGFDYYCCWLTAGDFFVIVNGSPSIRCDALDFFSVSLSVTRLTKTFDRP